MYGYCNIDSCTTFVQSTAVEKFGKYIIHVYNEILQKISKTCI